MHTSNYTLNEWPLPQASCTIIRPCTSTVSCQTSFAVTGRSHSMAKQDSNSSRKLHCRTVSTTCQQSSLQETLPFYRQKPWDQTVEHSSGRKVALRQVWWHCDPDFPQSLQLQPLAVCSIGGVLRDITLGSEPSSGTRLFHIPPILPGPVMGPVTPVVIRSRPVEPIHS